MEDRRRAESRSPHPSLQSVVGLQQHANAWRHSVETILVVGIDSVVGANLAAQLADHYQVHGLSQGPRILIDGCDTASVAFDAETPFDSIRQHTPDMVVYCGPAAHSAWELSTAARIKPGNVDIARSWADAAAQQGSRFTFISSDAVFTGPWMFHDEESLGICHSPEAAVIRKTEAAVRDVCPEALIVRTNAFGWSPAGNQGGWAESLIARLEANRLLDLDCIRHATPILATDLGGIIQRAWSENLDGTYHIGGAERVSPLQFAQRLADYFDLPWLSIRREETLSEKPEGFGAGETSLQTKQIRKALCVAMPMLSEGLDRLKAQYVNGYRDSFRFAEQPYHERVA